MHDRSVWVMAIGGGCRMALSLSLHLALAHITVSTMVQLSYIQQAGAYDGKRGKI